MKIGFIGLGIMGGSMAANLQRAGHEVQAHDLRRVEGFPRWAGSAAEAARGAEVVFTSLPGPAEVRTVGAALRGAMQKGAAWFDLSTNSPQCVRELHAEFAKAGLHVLDAPVSGGPTGAKSGKLAIWVGGERPVYDKHLAVLKAIGDEPYYVGPIGAGTVAKLAHNCASFTLQAAMAEVFTLGVKAGVDPLDLFKAVRQGASGRKRTFDRMAEHFLPHKFDPPAFSLRLAHKDMTLALELADRENVPMRQARIAMESMSEAMKRGWEGRDFRAFLTLQEERAGVSVAVPEEKLRAVL
ncbi:MAG TPA: NAD(P)-dependent oxidoreductase [Burkholderiales bacterium]|nr:NAD(P)-dependent oxidoreductase [Burkholderiales bacterium]